MIQFKCRMECCKQVMQRQDSPWPQGRVLVSGILQFLSTGQEADLQEAPQSLHRLPQLWRRALGTQADRRRCVWFRRAGPAQSLAQSSSSANVQVRHLLLPSCLRGFRVKRESSPGPKACRQELGTWLLPLSLPASHHGALPAATPP